MIPASLLTQGAGSSLTAPSSAASRSGDASAGVDLSGVGQFNPPAFAGLGLDSQWLVIGGIALAVVVLAWRR